MTSPDFIDGGSAPGTAGKAGKPGLGAPPPFPTYKPPTFQPYDPFSAEPNNIMGPVQTQRPPRGRERLNLLLAGNPHKPGSRAYDDWIISHREDPNDPTFSALLRGIQGPAFRRRELRQNPDLLRDSSQGWLPDSKMGRDVPRPVDDSLTPEDVEARERVLESKRNTPVIVGPDGEPIPIEQFGVDAQGQITQSVGVDGFQLNSGQANAAVRSGQFVWVGELAAQHDAGRFGEVTVDSGSYMLASSAAMLPYYWTPAQISYAQEALGLDPTGFVTQDLIGGWEQIVASAAGYTMAGRKIDPYQLLDMTYDATQAARRGGGGGGGGGAGVVVDRTVAAAFLNQAMMTEAGREATDEEVDAFHGILSGSPDADPGQLAVDFIRGQVGGEAASYQAATDYYSAMLAVLGARTQAEQPTEGGVA